MIQLSVTLTDYALALECFIFAWLFYNDENLVSSFNRWVVLFFVSVAVASLVGGTVHGFLLEETTFIYKFFWSFLMLVIGVTTLSGLSIGAKILMTPELAKWVIWGAFLKLCIYSGVVLFINNAFWIAIVDYFPAAFFLLVAFIAIAYRQSSLGLSLGAWGMVLVFVGAVLQQKQVSIHPIYFNHNSLYHVLQGIALAMVFKALRLVAIAR